VRGSVSWFPGASQPQDVRLALDGKAFYVADLTRNGVWLIDATRFRALGFIRTGRGPHGLLISRKRPTSAASTRFEPRFGRARPPWAPA
jgi:DNA-binding beta-propeller fold protein YncE